MLLSPNARYIMLIYSCELKFNNTHQYSTIDILVWKIQAVRGVSSYVKLKHRFPIVYTCCTHRGVMQKNWQGRLELGELTIEVPKAPSCETPQASRGWGLGRGCTPPPVD